MITEGESQLRRRWLAVVDRGQIGLLIGEKLFVRDITPVEIDLPCLRKSAQWNPRIVLDENATVVQEKIAHAVESLSVHQVRRGFEQTDARTLARAPFQEWARTAGQIGFEIIQGLVRSAAGRERDPHSFRRVPDVGSVDDVTAHPREKDVKDRESAAEIWPGKLGPHVFGDEIMSLQHGVHRSA